MYMSSDRFRRIVLASWIGIVANALLAVLKIVVGAVSGSFAVISDGIDSGNDILTSVVTLFTAYVSRRPPDKRFPYGYARADTLATKLLSFVIFFAGAQLIISTLRHALTDTPQLPSGPLVFYVTGASILVKVALAAYKIRVGRRVHSAMLVADGKNMQNDVIISVAVLIGLAGTHIFKMPIIDSITAVVVSVWIIKVALQIFIQSNVELMDGMQNTAVYQAVFDAVGSVPEAHNPHRTRVRRLGHMYVVILDIEVDPHMDVGTAHEIALETERAIAEQVPRVYDVVVHVEPYGNVEQGERYGLADDAPP
jgi:cation diffusion facilitator family transporter